ncbi:MAG TPA: hypothetical protein VIM97_15105, partial [Actinomycetes bacterium]
MATKDLRDAIGSPWTLSSNAPGAKGARTVADHCDMVKAADEFDPAVLDTRDEYRRLGLERQRHPGPSAGRQAGPATHLELTAKLTTAQ